jgi:hypothetical protein
MVLAVALLVAIGATAAARQGGGATVAVQAQKATAAPGRDVEAEAVLARAREALGGAGALDQVKSLILVRHDHTTEKILFPDRMQTILGAPWGDSVITLEGNRRWVRNATPPASVAAMLQKGQKPEAAADVAAVVRRFRLQVVDHSLRYLLHPPAGYAMRVRSAGTVTHGPVTGQAVEFSAADGHSVSLVFDASSGMPKAFVWKIGGSDPAVSGTLFVEELRDYRRVGPILVPFQIAEHRLRLDKWEALAVWRFTRIEVNPPLTVADFHEPPGK